MSVSGITIFSSGKIKVINASDIAALDPFEDDDLGDLAEEFGLSSGRQKNKNIYIPQESVAMSPVDNISVDKVQKVEISDRERADIEMQEEKNKIIASIDKEKLKNSTGKSKSHKSDTYTLNEIKGFAITLGIPVSSKKKAEIIDLVLAKLETPEK